MNIKGVVRHPWVSECVWELMFNPLSKMLKTLKLRTMNKDLGSDILCYNWVDWMGLFIKTMNYEQRVS